MKEATGELNGMLVVVLAIGALIAFFYYTLWPLINNNISANLRCNKAICEPCTSKKKDCPTVKCWKKGVDHTDENAFECVYKG